MGSPDVTTQTQFVREAPQIEAYKLGLLELAKQRAEIPVNVSDPRLQQQTAGLSPQQLSAIQNYEAGIGSYQPYMEDAYSTLGQGIGTVQQGLGFANEAADMARYAPTSANLASQGITGAVNTATQGLTGAVNTATQGLTGIAQGLTGQTTYDPNQAEAFMDPYQKLVTRQALDEIDRSAGMQRQQIDDAALAAGAFGGSRRTLAQSEFDRNLADIKSKRVVEDSSKNYLQALGASMQADETAKARQLQASQLGIGAYGQAGQIGVQGYGQAGQLGVQGYGQAGQLGLTGQELGLKGLQGVGGFYGQTGGQLGEFGLAQARLGESGTGLRGEEARLLSTLGAGVQTSEQARLEAARNNAMQQAYEPFQRIGFLSDMYKGAPTSQSAILQTTSPGTSTLNQLVGTGISALGGYKAYQSMFNPKA